MQKLSTSLLYMQRTRHITLCKVTSHGPYLYLYIWLRTHKCCSKPDNEVSDTINMEMCIVISLAYTLSW